MSTSDKTKAAPLIIRRARDFDRQNKIEVGVLPYGNDVIHIAPPYHGAHDGEDFRAWVEYDISFTSVADYGLHIEYAALASRPCGIYWDNKQVQSGSIGLATGGWGEGNQIWEKQGVVSGGPGVHVLRIQRHDAIPHIRTIRLVLENG